MAFMTVNWLSIVLAAVAAWLFGGVYYSALGKQWMAAQDSLTGSVSGGGAVSPAR